MSDLGESVHLAVSMEIPGERFDPLCVRLPGEIRYRSGEIVKFHWSPIHRCPCC